jgi:hypothetical protein
MKIYRNILALVTLIALAMACEKEKYDDISFISTAPVPANISAYFDITQDNTGLVTIYPTGESVSSFEVYFGDGTTNPGTTLAGKSVQHRYAEGQFDVRIVAHNSSGKTTEKTVPLTVSFRAPENLEVTATIDASNNFKVNVTAKAMYETLFKVYFGDVQDEIPVSFLEGESVSHTYAAVGTYTLRVVALSGGAAITEFTKDITIVDPLLLPITFESPTLAYNFVNFDGGNATVIDNPHVGGINTSSKVGQMIKNAGQVWGGSVITLSSPIDFSANKYFRMKVYSPRIGAKVLLKVENATNSGVNYEKEVSTTQANAWEELIFDYTGINTDNSYHKVVLIFELGTMGDGSANFTFYFDDIKLTADANVLQLPLDFESTSIDYAFTNFDGGSVTIIDNPQSGSINTSSKVAQMVKNAGQTWGGSYITLSNPIDFTNKYFRMKVYSPRIGAKVLLKVENLTNGGIFFEKELTTSMANAWEELIFDYSTINTANTYQKIVLIFDNGTAGDGSANFTFLFDDIRLTADNATLSIPLNFESSSISYPFMDFDGGNATVIDNPHIEGINTSSKVVRMIKNAGQPWGGSWIGLVSPIDFTGKTAFKMKVFAPKVGAKVLLKVENQTNGSLNFEKEVTTSVANAWEELTFDYSAINTANSYQKIVIIFELGTVGNGSADFTYYFDDITLN